MQDNNNNNTRFLCHERFNVIIVDILLIFMLLFRYQSLCYGQCAGYRCVGNFVENSSRAPPLKPPPGAGCTMDLCDRELTCSKVSKQGFQKMCLFFCSAAPVVAVVVVVVLVVFF